MRYECKYKRGVFPKGAHAVEFKIMQEAVGLDKLGEKIFFGVFNSASESVLASMPGETTESLDNFIQGLPDFINRKPGEFGIWPEAERLGKIVVGHEQDGKLKYLRGLGVDLLKRMLALGGKPVPMNATEDQLVLEAAKLDGNAPVAAEEGPAGPPTPPPQGMAEPEAKAKKK